MSLSTANLYAMNQCAVLFNACKNAEDCSNLELQPVEQVLQSMKIKTTNIVTQISSGSPTRMTMIRGSMIVNSAIGTCDEKLSKLKQVADVVSKKSLKLMALQNLDISEDVLDLVFKTCKSVDTIRYNINQDTAETKSLRAFYARALGSINTKLAH